MMRTTQSSSLRVLAVVNWLNRGGIEVQLMQALPRLKQHGIQLDICCLGKGVLDDIFKAQGSTIHRIPKTGNCYATARCFQKLLARERYDVIHSHLGYVSGGVVLGAARHNVPMAVSFHSAAPLSLQRWRAIPGLRQLRALWLYWHKRLIQHNADVFVGHSQENIRAFAPHWRQQPDRCKIIYNGVLFPKTIPSKGEARRVLGLDASSLVLLHVGSLRSEKNHGGLLRIMKAVRRCRADVKMLMVGSGPLHNTIAKQALQLNVEDCLNMVGMQEDVWPYYAAADAFVFPSTLEGFGNVLVEAQSARLPIVASDIPAHRESVAPAQHRFLFPLPDYEAAAEMIMEQTKTNDRPWLEDSEDYIRGHFSIEQFAASLRNLYDEMTVKKAA